MKIDLSKLSNKDDLATLIALILLLCLLAFALYLSATNESFLAGFVVATMIWKWKSWVYDPIDRFLEKHWPFEAANPSNNGTEPPARD
jgi:hypothetical protein